MGYSAIVRVVVGLKIKQDQLFTKSEKPSCSHKEATGNKFCPKCGKQKSMDCKPVDGYCEERASYRGYGVFPIGLCDRIEEVVIGTEVGKVVACEGPDCVRIKVREGLKSLTSDLERTSESWPIQKGEFGLWLVKYESF